MTMKSSTNLGTGKESKTEITMSSRKPKENAARKAELTTMEKVVADSQDNPTPEAIAEVIDEAGPTDEVLIEAAAATDDYAELLADGRERIDAIDDQILELIIRRVETASALLAEKHSRRINPRDKVRQNAICIRLVEQAAELNVNGVNLNKHQIREIFELLIRLGVENHRQTIIDRR